MNYRTVECEGVDWVELAHGGVQWRFFCSQERKFMEIKIKWKRRGAEGYK
jgi:hypothetical protein